MPRKKARAYYVSRKQAKELLAQPGCTKDDELSQYVHGDAYLLADGKVLLYLGDEIKEIVYESKEELLSVVSKPRRNKTNASSESEEGLVDIGEVRQDQFNLTSPGLYYGNNLYLTDT